MLWHIPGYPAQMFIVSDHFLPKSSQNMPNPQNPLVFVLIFLVNFELTKIIGFHFHGHQSEGACYCSARNAISQLRIWGVRISEIPEIAQILPKHGNPCFLLPKSLPQHLRAKMVTVGLSSCKTRTRKYPPITDVKPL